MARSFRACNRHVVDRCSTRGGMVIAGAALAVIVSALSLAGCGGGESSTPLERYQAGVEPHEAVDEAMGGRTLRGTPVTPRTEDCFPAEPRDLFWEMDWVVDENGNLGPIDFDENRNGVIDDPPPDAKGNRPGSERDAIRGRNTWLLWGGGNEAFWGWLQERGYGLQDFLILLDSRRRDHRFEKAGLINQPGFTSSNRTVLGLYLDKEASPGSAMLRPPPPAGGATGVVKESYYTKGEPERYDAQGRMLPKEVERPSVPSSHHHTELFVPWTEGLEEIPPEFAAYAPDVVRRHLVQDGVDPAIYGYPSGIFGLRLFLNPDFFAKTEDAARARAYWKERVEKTNGRYYTDPAIYADPNLVRPFRVSMSCGFCHVGPHPLNPPADPEHPEWRNLSGVIGDQYWDPQPANGNLLRRNSFLHHFLKSQAPGTIDTSLVSTDQINNTNVINAVFDVPARLERAATKPTEKQSRENLLLPGIEDPGSTSDQRHFPMVLFPGEDSIGVFGALARVPLNIGVFSEQWLRVDNPIIGFTPQRPFRIETNRANSVFWNVNEHYRVGYMAKFFTVGGSRPVDDCKWVSKSTAPMKLKDAPHGRDALPDGEAPLRARGRDVFIDNCAICHSSKQPDGFDLAFDLDRSRAGRWTTAPVPEAPSRHVYTLPMDYTDWEDFKKSPAYRDYLRALRARPDVAARPTGIDECDPFIDKNFLSNELRIPVTLIGTYSGRAMATNAMKDHVWDNFSSETFKGLESVGAIRYYDPFLGKAVDPLYGTNAVYTDGRDHGGPGYYRPASLISLWATAPYLHNNALGRYTHDPSVQGRLSAFDDGIRKLLWNERRAQFKSDRDGVTFAHPGDLRLEGSPSARNDPGYIYRLPVDTRITFAAPFVPQLLEGVLVGYVGPRLGGLLFALASTWLWVGLAGLFLWAAFRGRMRHVGMLLLAIALLMAAVLLLATLTVEGGMMSGGLMVAGTMMMQMATPTKLWVLVAGLAVVGATLMLTRWETRAVPRIVFGALTIAIVVGGTIVHQTLDGRRGGVDVGPIPRGVPVNLLMNIDPEKTDKLPAAIAGLVRALGEINRRGLTGDAAYEVFSARAGPALIAASKCPDMVLDRGHWFGEFLSDEDKESLIAFLKTI